MTANFTAVQYKICHFKFIQNKLVLLGQTTPQYAGECGVRCLFATTEHRASKPFTCRIRALIHPS
jgi:hypothetical protein